MPIFSPVKGNPQARLAAPIPAPSPVVPATRPAPATKLDRTYWTRRRMLDGLRRVWLDFGQTPTSSEAYNDLVRFTGGTTRRPGRYPSFYAVLRWYPSFREAWGAIGLQQDRYWEGWSELDDWYLREGAGILSRKELAADLRRSPDAVHRRLYDLGLHTWQRWGWSAHRIERCAGIPLSTLKRYMSRGDLPYLRGSRVLYLDPADLTIVEEIDWINPPPELGVAVRDALRQRIMTTLNGGDWRVGRVHQPHPLRSTERRWSLKLSHPTPRPTDVVPGDMVRCTRPVVTRPAAEGRSGKVQAVFWSGVRNKLREQVEPGWFARVEFPKVKARGDAPRVTYTLPVAVLERVPFGPARPADAGAGS